MLLAGCAMYSDPASTASLGQVRPAIPNAHVETRGIRRLPPIDASAQYMPTRQQAISSRPQTGVRLASYQQSADEIGPSSDGPLVLNPINHDAPADGVYNVSLSHALALGGANSLQIELAREKTLEAEAEWAEARSAILPTLWVGIGYNKHDGRLQETQGDVLEVSRNSTFVGGGAGLSNASLAGGSGGPSRLVVNLSLADAIFEPLAGLQAFTARGAAESATVNDSLAEIAVAYYDLVEAHGKLASLQRGLTATEEMVRLTTLLAQAGEGSKAEVYRTETERSVWQQRLADADRQIVVRRASLARLLRLGPDVKLTPVEDHLAPVEMIAENTSVEELVATGLVARPEMAQHQSLVAATLTRLRQECVRPWLPYIQLGASAGSFGGGPSSTFENEAGRSDVDLLAVWEVRNLGFGNNALRRRRASQLRQAEVEAELTRDKIVSEIVIAASDVASYRRQIETTLVGLAAAKKSYVANRQRIQEAEGLPIELIQAIRAKADAENSVNQAVSSYNRAQFQLLRAIGRPPEADMQL